MHRAIHAASQDYFIWSRGHILYDRGVEALMQVYSARQLFDVFSRRHEVTVHLERPLAELDPTRKKGRVDMTLEFGKDALYAIEFKRYSNPAQIGADLTRLREIAAKPDRVGLFAAPCFMKERDGENWDWPLRAKHQSESSNPSEKWHLSERQKLPYRFTHDAAWSHERALVIEVALTIRRPQRGGLHVG